MREVYFTKMKLFRPPPPPPQGKEIIGRCSVREGDIVKREERARIKKDREGTKKEKRKIKLQDICQRG
jgi:hypothetical protein